MTDAVGDETRAALEAAAAMLADAGAPTDVIERLRALIDQIGQPCVVAVVGQVNAGKSTFINALLGEDRAVVGNTETTATTNHFVYGPPGTDETVRCHWRAGHVTVETPEFLASLRGHDPEAVTRSAAIARLEFAIPSPMLRTITLVDTPGTGAVVGEHESRTAELLELRDRHHAETVAIHERADAVIYLVGAVAQVADEAMLERFAARSDVRARAMDTLGVLAKTDLSPELIERRHQLARKIAGQLESELNDVVPVSAGLARAIAHLGDERLQALIGVARRLPEAQFELLLKDERLFTQYEPADCAVPAAERRELFSAAACEWRVFVVIIQSAREFPLASELRERLDELAGFGVLRRTLDEQFVQRAEMLRCFRIGASAREVLKEYWFGRLIERRRRRASDRARLDRFVAFLDGARGDPEVAAELRAHLTAELASPGDSSRLEEAWKTADGELSALLTRLGEFSADFAALQELEASPQVFSPSETDELRALLGLYGTDARRRLRGDVRIEQCLERQVGWRLSRDGSRRGTARWRVADRAHSRLGLIMETLRP